MADPHPYSGIDLDQITARNQTARRMIAGFSAEMPVLADFWRQLDIALADNLTLSAEVAWLTAELAATRLDRANLLAAMRGTTHLGHLPSMLAGLSWSLVLPSARDSLLGFQFDSNTGLGHLLRRTRRFTDRHRNR